MEYKVITITEPRTGMGQHGEWKNQDIIVEAVQNQQYPDRYVLTLKGKNVDKAMGIKVGDVVNAEWSSLVREYTKQDGTKGCTQQHVCWKMEPAGF